MRLATGLLLLAAIALAGDKAENANATVFLGPLKAGGVEENGLGFVHRVHAEEAPPRRARLMGRDRELLAQYAV